MVRSIKLVDIDDITNILDMQVPGIDQSKGILCVGPRKIGKVKYLADMAERQDREIYVIDVPYICNLDPLIDYPEKNFMVILRNIEFMTPSQVNWFFTHNWPANILFCFTSSSYQEIPNKIKNVFKPWSKICNVPYPDEETRKFHIRNILKKNNIGGRNDENMKQLVNHTENMNFEEIDDTLRIIIYKGLVTKKKKPSLKEILKEVEFEENLGYDKTIASANFVDLLDTNIDTSNYLTVIKKYEIDYDSICYAAHKITCKPNFEVFRGHLCKILDNADFIINVSRFIDNIKAMKNTVAVVIIPDDEKLLGPIFDYVNEWIWLIKERNNHIMIYYGYPTHI
jgi:hypothetical protein